MKLPRLDKESIIFFAVTFFIGMSIGMTSPLVPEMRDYFKLSYTTTGLILSSFGIARMFLSLPSGYFYRHIKRKTLILSGIAFLATGSILAGFSGSFQVYLLSQLLMGAGFSMCITTIVISLSMKANKSNRGSVMGMNSFSMSGASVLAPGIAGYISIAYTWRGVYFVYSAVALLFFIIIAYNMENEEIAKSSNARTYKKSKNHNLIIVTAFFVIFLATFLFSGFRNSTIPLFAKDSLGLDAGTIGLILSMTSLVFFITGPLSAHLSDKYGRKIFIMTGLFSMLVGLVLFFFATKTSHLLILLVFLGYGSIINVVSVSLLGDMTPDHMAGRNYGIMRFIGDFGIVTGPIAAGMIIDTYGFHAMSVFISIFVIIALVLVLILVKDTKFHFKWGKIFDIWE